jgi:hypothetical protein
VQDRGDLLLLALLALGLLRFVGVRGREGLGGDHHRAGVRRHVDVVDAPGPRGHHPGLATAYWQQPQQRFLGLVVVLERRVGACRREQQRAVGQERRARFTLRTAGQASRRSLAGRVGLPQRSDVSGALGVQRLYRGHQPGAVRRQGQAAAAWKFDVGVEVVEGGLGVRITHDACLPRRLQDASILFRL